MVVQFSGELRTILWVSACARLVYCCHSPLRVVLSCGQSKLAPVPHLTPVNSPVSCVLSASESLSSCWVLVLLLG